MKTTSILLAGVLLASGFAAYAYDSSEAIPAPTLQLRPAGTLPQPQRIVTSSPIPAAQVQVIPTGHSNQQSTASYDRYSAPSTTVVR